MSRLSYRYLLLRAAASIILFVLIIPCFAKSINILEQPDAKAKVVGQIDLAKGVIPIFTPKNSDWVKVADPSNGNVGWMKATELTQNGTTSFSYTQKISNDGKAETQSMTIGKPAMTDQQWRDYYMKMQLEQRSIQESAQKTIQNMMLQLNQLYKEQNALFINMGFPVLNPTPATTVPAPSLPVQKPIDKNGH